MLKRRFYLFITLCLLLTIGFILIHVYTNQLIYNNKQLIKLSSFKKNKLNYRLLDHNDPQHYQFTTTISRSRLTKANGPLYKLIVYRLTGQWYKVYFNGQLIGSKGDSTQGESSNIWNALTTFDIAPSLIKDQNQLTVKVQANYNVGLLTFPLIITNNQLAAKINNWFKLFLNDFNIIAIGGLLATLLLLPFIYKANLGKEYIFYFLATLFILIAVLDYLTLYQLPCSLLLFKKIILLANCLAVASISLALYYQFAAKINLVLAGILICGSLTITFLSADMITFRSYWFELNLLNLLNLIGWVFTTGRQFKDSYAARILFIASLLSIYDVINVLLMNEISANLSVAVTRFFIFPLAILIIIIDQHLKLQQKIAYQTAKADMMYQRSIKDPMTKIYNHQYMTSVLENKQPPYSVIMLDVDNFKEINDTYGHQVGDAAIKHVGNKIKQAVRKQDLVGRYGGDEFIIICDCTSQEEVKTLAQRIKNTIKQPISTPEGVEITLTVSIGISTHPEQDSDPLKIADQALYSAKRNGKAQITIFTEAQEKSN